jgi:hypothetical protein
VVAALFARATGMEHKMTRVFCHRGEPVTASYTAHLPPDIRACMFWLRNRRPAQWRDNRPFVDEQDDDDWVSELEEAAERARRISAHVPLPSAPSEARVGGEEKGRSDA